MSDWREIKESDVQKAHSKTEGERVSLQGVAAIQGSMDVQDTPAEEYPERKFTDAQRRDLSMRTYPSGDSYYVRVYDNERTPQLPENATYGNVGRANLHLERDANGDVGRARLQDIETLPAYRRAGIGSRMLEQCEHIARQNGAQEIYGSFTADEGREEETRQWYAKRGYEFRRDGREVYKALTGKIQQIGFTNA